MICFSGIDHQKYFSIALWPFLGAYSIIFTMGRCTSVWSGTTFVFYIMKRATSGL